VCFRGLAQWLLEGDFEPVAGWTGAVEGASYAWRKMLGALETVVSSLD